MKKLFSPLFSVLVFSALFLLLAYGGRSNPAFASSVVPVSGKAKFLNTGVYLDFTNYNSNVVIAGSTGNFEGYGWAEGLGWVAFGSADNDQGPVNVNPSTGVVTGKAKVLNTGAYLDFTNYNSNVTINLSTGVFSGYVWSEGEGWVDFSDTGVSFSDTEAPSPDPATFSTNPTASSVSQIDMVATTASDNGFGAINYYFEETSGNSGGTSSGWQTGASYSDDGLSANTQYTYRVKSRDGASTPNETAYSSEVSAYTLANQPDSPTAESQDYSSTNGYWVKITIPNTGGNPDDGNPSGTEYAVTIDGGSTWLTSSGGTSSSKSWSSTYSDYWYHKNLNPNTSYTYHLLARNGDGTETSLSSSGATVTTAPASPGDLSSSAVTATTATVSWSASSGADTYTLSYGTSPTADDTVISGITATSYDLSGLTAGTKYYFKARAVSVANGTGAYSSASYFFTTGDISLSLTVDSNSQITASWGETTGGTAVSYHLERATQSDYSDAVEVYDALSPRQYISSGLNPNQVYYFRVRAEFAGSVFGSWNNSSAETLPSSPSDLSASASYSSANGNTLSLSWTSPGASAITYFKVFRGGDKDTGVLVATLANTVTTYDDTALSPNTSYSYYVYGVNSGGAYSADSATASAYTLASTPGDLSAVASYDANNGYQVALSWTSGGGQKNYRLFRGGDKDSGTLIYSGVSPSYTDTSLSAYTTYAYYVYGMNEEDAYSPSYQTASDTTPCAQATDLAGVAQANAITWRWDRVTGASSYKVYNNDDDSLLKTITASDAGCAGSSTTCSYKETALSSNTAYSRYVSAYSAYGEGKPSSAVTKYTLPATPNSLIIASQDYSSAYGLSLKLSWTSGGAQAGYKIFRGGDKDSGTLITASAITGASHRDTGLNPNSTYSYYVYAVNPDGDYSDYISGLGYTAPGKVSGLSASASSDSNEITYTWSSVSGADGYYIYDADSGELLKTAGASATAFTRTGLSWNTRYGVFVRAYNDNGTGQASDTAYDITPQEPEESSSESDDEEDAGTDTEAPSASTSHPQFGLSFPAPSGIHLAITNFKIRGYAEPISMVSVYHSTTPGGDLVWEKLGETQADGGGYFELGERRYDYGVHHFRIRARDSAGNVSAYTGTVTIYIDAPLEIPIEQEIIKEAVEEKIAPIKETREKIGKNVGYFSKGLKEELSPLRTNLSYFDKGLRLEAQELLAKGWMTIPRRIFLAFRDLAKGVGDSSLSLSQRLRVALFNFKEILFADEFLRISNVRVVAVGSDTVTVSWQTNHYADSKVNFGKTLAYGKDYYRRERVLEHLVTLTGLEPETTYYFEVLSRNGTSAYDAWHRFDTLPAE